MIIRVILAFMVGVVFGVTIMALMVAARDDE